MIIVEHQFCTLTWKTVNQSTVSDIYSVSWKTANQSTVSDIYSVSWKTANQRTVSDIYSVSWKTANKSTVSDIYSVSIGWFWSMKLVLESLIIVSQGLLSLSAWPCLYLHKYCPTFYTIKRWSIMHDKNYKYCIYDEKQNKNVQHVAY